MNSKHMMTMAYAAAVCGSVSSFAETAEGWLANNETSIVSAEVSLALDSKFLSYGLVDNNEPILTPGASFIFYDLVTFGVSAIFDVSHYGKDAGYGNRAWRYQELDPSVTLARAFSSDDAGWLPTTVAFELGYMYEAHPEVMGDDTQFFNFVIALPDLWLEPMFAYELDLDRDRGTYLNLELGHTFTLCGPREKGVGDVLDFRLSVAQGWGDTRRISAYLPDLNSKAGGGFEHAGLMDTCIKGELAWAVADDVTLVAHVAYSDYVFDSTTREASRHYEATGRWESSWNFVAGVSLSVTF